MIEALIRIYSYDVDFQHKAQPGDSFDVLYAQDDETPGTDAKGEVLFAALTIGGEAKKYYRFQTPDDGIVDYYDETGKSAKKFLVRKPVATGIMRSGFGARNHPLLGYTRCTPALTGRPRSARSIYASGNGTVEKVGWESRLRQVRPHPPRQRLRDRLRPHDRVRRARRSPARACARAR